ncbi:MAG: hypothetical protein WD716_13595 [Fimbriimonadaceae bacterium]
MAAQLTGRERRKLKKVFIALLPKDGSSKGNMSLQPEWLALAKTKVETALEGSHYWEIRDLLIGEGVISTGKGRGGSVMLTGQNGEEEEEPVAQTESAAYRSEQDLYDPLYKTIKGPWLKQQNIEDHVIEITANQGRRDTGGKWTRPDLTLAAVRVFPFMPGKTLEVITFEVKPLEAFGIEGVFETASHSIFANRSYLLVHVNPGTVPSADLKRLSRVAARFGVGLATFVDPLDFDSFTFYVDAAHQSPDPMELNEFINLQLSGDSKEKIRRMIR